MGKRKHKDSQEYYRKKIRKLEKRLRRYDRNSSGDSGRSQGDRSRSNSLSSIEIESDPPSPQSSVRSAIHLVEGQHATPPIGDDLPAGESSNTISADILDALGNPKGKQEIFGPKIQEEISKRWGLILCLLCQGLNKDQRKEILEKIFVPENLQLVKAPKLNAEIAAILAESPKNRDKRLEKVQKDLGLCIAALTNLVSTLIEKDIDKLEIIKRISEVNQIMLDLHSEETLNRRKLITYTLDKKFLNIIREVPRDSLLFGENLSEKIKASKSAEKSGLLCVRKTHHSEATTTKKNTGQQGNWRGPPRQAHRLNRRGGARNQQPYRSTKKPAAASERHRDSSRTQSRPQFKPL